MILADGEDVRDLVPDDERIRLIAITGSPEIGEKRNFGCEHSSEIICHWDDDDHSAPERLVDQLGRLSASGKSATGYHSMRFHDGITWWKYHGAPQYALGTSLCYRKSWWEKNKFPSLQVGEDNAFVHTAGAAGQLVSVDAGDLMWASVHAGNSSPRRMSGDSWKRLAA